MRTSPRLELASTLFLAALAPGLATETALAQGRPEQTTYFNEYGPGEACPFPVRIEVSGKEKVILLPGGRLIIASPGLTATFTNLDTSERTTQVITGSIKVTFSESGDAELVFTGRNFLELFKPELPTLALPVGRLSVTLDPDGKFV